MAIAIARRLEGRGEYRFARDTDDKSKATGDSEGGRQNKGNMGGSKASQQGRKATQRRHTTAREDGRKQSNAAQQQ